MEISLNSQPDVSLPLFSAFAASQQRALLAEGEKALANSAAKFDFVAEARGGRTFLKETRTRFEPKPDSSENIHHHLCRELIAFDPDVALFFDLNADLIDTNLDSFEVLRSEQKDDSILMLYRSTTKKVLMIQPRVCLVLRCIRKNRDGSFIDAQKSVEVLGLEDHPDVKPLIEEAGDKLATVHLIATKYTPISSGITLKTSTTKLDVHTSIGLILLKPFIAGSQKKYAARFSDSFAEFYDSQQFRDGRQLFWFSPEYDLILQRYQERKDDNAEIEVEIDRREEVTSSPLWTSIG